MFMDYNSYDINDIYRALKCREAYKGIAGATGDYTFSDIVMDAETIIQKANLTERQRLVIKLYHEDDLTLATIGEMLGITHQAVKDCLNQASKKINKVLEGWKDGSAI